MSVVLCIPWVHEGPSGIVTIALLSRMHSALMSDCLIRPLSGMADYIYYSAPWSVVH
jgi:hypothetical protein